jgi:prophage tail gpP-like protein
MIELCDTGKSACQVATERGILCKGFKRDSDEELRRRYAPYVGAAEKITRSDLERAANHWQLARQRAEETLLACDVQNHFYQTCRGWNDFSNEELSEFCLELTGVHPMVIGEITFPNM